VVRRGWRAKASTAALQPEQVPHRGRRRLRNRLALGGPRQEASQVRWSTKLVARTENSGDPQLVLAAETALTHRGWATLPGPRPW